MHWSVHAVTDWGGSQAQGSHSFIWWVLFTHYDRYLFIKAYHIWISQFKCLADGCILPVFLVRNMPVHTLSSTLHIKHFKLYCVYLTSQSHSVLFFDVSSCYPWACTFVIVKYILFLCTKCWFWSNYIKCAVFLLSVYLTDGAINFYINDLEIDDSSIWIQNHVFCVLNSIASVF